jgi:hypothetical protein
MKIIDINTVDLPIDSSKFNILKDSEYPLCLLGFQIKNAYDQKRHCIPKKYKPVDVVHILHFPETTPLFFRGIILNPTNKLVTLLNDLLDKSLMTVTNEAYNNTLKQHSLTCDNCWTYLRPGIFPIDGHYLKTLANNDIDINELYSEIFANKDIPFFQSISYLTIYILDNKNLAYVSNKEFAEKLIADYKIKVA